MNPASKQQLQVSFPHPDILATRDDDTAAQANIALATMELKPATIHWLVEDVLKEFKSLEHRHKCGYRQRESQTLIYIHFVTIWEGRTPAPGIFSFGISPNSDKRNT